MNSIQAKTLKTLIEETGENFVVIDVREKFELMFKKINDKRVINIPMSQIEKEWVKLDKNPVYYILCQSGGRSSSVTQFLQSKNINAINVEGGIGSY